MVIYPFRLFGNSDPNSNEDKLVEKLKSAHQLVCGISIGIPDNRSEERMDYDYVINRVAQMELIEGTSDQSNWHESFDEDDDETDE
jgi:hypothetical protein